MKLSNEEKLGMDAIVLILLLYSYGFVVGAMFVTKNHSYLALSICAILIPAFIYSFRKIAEAIIHRFQGLKGEFKVSVVLRELWPEGVRSIDDIVIDPKRGNVDHVAVAKTGVWVIETKYIGGEITLKNGLLAKNGKVFPKNYLQQAYAEASAVHEYLTRHDVKSVPVRPVLVFAGEYSKVRFGFTPIDGVFVVGCLGLHRLIDDPKFGNNLSKVEIEMIIKILSDIGGA
jgi:hypothetical protein